MITVPEDFATELGPEALKWRDTLPALATRFCARWRLTPDGALMNGFVAVVLPVRQADGHPAVLKLTWLDEETRHEPLALKIWDGNGVVRLLDHDDEHGALLLERLDHTFSLHDAPIEEAVAVTGGLLRTLRVPAPPEIRRVRGDLPDHPAVPRRLLGAAREYGRMEAGHTLVNEDLHYENVLRGDREPWLMIDPKPLSGDPEYCVIPLLRNRFREIDGARGLRDRMAALVDIGELDAGRAHGWTVCRAVADWIWFLEAGLPEEAEVSATIAQWMTES